MYIVQMYDWANVIGPPNFSFEIMISFRFLFKDPCNDLIIGILRQLRKATQVNRKLNVKSRTIKNQDGEWETASWVGL